MYHINHGPFSKSAFLGNGPFGFRPFWYPIGLNRWHTLWCTNHGLGERPPDVEEQSVEPPVALDLTVHHVAGVEGQRCHTIPTSTVTGQLEPWQVTAHYKCVRLHHTITVECNRIL